MKRIAGLLILLTGCGSSSLNQADSKPKVSLEELITKSIETFAENSTSCKEEKINLVRKDKTLIRNLVAQVKNLPANNTTQPNADQTEMIFKIFTSDGFKVVVGQTADVINAISANDTIIENLTSIRDDLLSEPGDRIAELITALASDRSQQDALLGAARSALCNNPSETDLVSLLLTPQVLWQLGPDAAYLLASPLAKHIRPLLLAIQQVSIPDELSQFIALVKEMLPQQDICSIDNLDAYQPHLALVLSLLKTGDTPNESRPLRSFVNVLFKLYSMEDSNQCTGTSFDDLKKQTIQNVFLTTSKFLSDEQRGVVGVLKRMKPRT